MNGEPPGQPLALPLLPQQQQHQQPPPLQPPTTFYQHLYSQQQQQQLYPQQQQQQQQSPSQQRPPPPQQQPLPLPPGYPSAPRLPKKRTRTGCLTCRKRKHKCGEERPHCARCLRAGMECVWPAEGSGSSASAAAALAGGSATAAAAGPSLSTAAAAGSSSTAAESAKAKARPYPPPNKRASSSSSSTRTAAAAGVLSRGTSGDRSGSFGQSGAAAGGPTAQTSTASSTTSSPRPLGHPHLFHPSAPPPQQQQQQPYGSAFNGAFYGVDNGRSPHPLSQDPASIHHHHPHHHRAFSSPAATGSVQLGLADQQQQHQQQQQQTVVLNQPTYPILSPFAPPPQGHQHHSHLLQHQNQQLSSPSSPHVKNLQHLGQQQQQQQRFDLSGHGQQSSNAEAGPSRLAPSTSSITGGGSGGSGGTLGLADFEAYFAGYTAEQWAAMLDPEIGGRSLADGGSLLLAGSGGIDGLANGFGTGSFDHPALAAHEQLLPQHLPQHQQQAAADQSVLDLHAAWLALDASSSAALAAGAGGGEPSPSLWLHSSPPALDGATGGGGGGMVDEPDQLASGRPSDSSPPPPSTRSGPNDAPAAAAAALKWIRTPSPSAAGGSLSAANSRTPSSISSPAAADRMTGIEPASAAGSDSAGSTPRGRPPFRSGFAHDQQQQQQQQLQSQQQAVEEPPVKAWSPSQWQMVDEDDEVDLQLEQQQQKQQQKQQQQQLQQELQQQRQHQHQPAPAGQVSLPRYTTPTSSLVLLFPNPEERHLMQHFLYSVPALFVGIQASSPLEMAKFATEEHPNLNSFFPFLDIPHFLSLPRGQSSAADALALSLMSVGAGRLSHLYHSEAGEDPSVEGNSRRYSQLSVSLMQASLGLGQTSLAFARLKGKGVGPALSIDSAADGNAVAGAQQQQGMDDSEITQLLAACSSCILARCLAGGRGFEGALDLARGVVEFAGGPKKMLDALSTSGSTSSATAAASATSGSATITSLDPPSTPYTTAGGSLGASSLTTPTTTSKATRRKRLRMLRSVLEDLASWDLFASLSSGAKPSAFSSSSPHSTGSGGGLAEWLFAYSPPSGTREGTSGEEDWETLESTLGFSRILMDLFSRVNVLYATSRSPPAGSSEPQTATLAIQLLHEIRIRKADVLRSYPELAQPFFPGPCRGDDPEVEEELGRRVRYGRLGRDDEHEGEGLGRGKARRLQFGDLIWTLTLEIMVRTEVQDEPTDSAEIKALADRIVTLVQEAHRRSLVTLGFLWPLIIAGTMFDAESDRQAALSAIETLRSYTCFDLQSGQEILREVWIARDAGDRRKTFRDVAQSCGTVVL